MYTTDDDNVAPKRTVRARSRDGAKSLDLTIPAAVTRDHHVAAGDVFALEVTEKADKLVLTYTRVYGGSG